MLIVSMVSNVNLVFPSRANQRDEKSQPDSQADIRLEYRLGLSTIVFRKCDRQCCTYEGLFKV